VGSRGLFKTAWDALKRIPAGIGGDSDGVQRSFYMNYVRLAVCLLPIYRATIAGTSLMPCSK
jgi:hypothetical protein